MAKSTGQVCFKNVGAKVLTLSAANAANEVLEVTFRPPWIINIDERLGLIAALRIELAFDNGAFLKVELISDFTREVIVFANQAASLKDQERLAIVVY
jgi:hypothetical protein